MTAEGPASSAASDAALAATLLAIDPRGLGGAALRAGPGPAREAWIALARAGLPPGAPVRRAPLHIDDDRLLGGLDLASSLAAGRPVAQRGVLADCDGGLLLLPMAERIEPGVAARLSAARLDIRAGASAPDASTRSSLQQLLAPKPGEKPSAEEPAGPEPLVDAALGVVEAAGRYQRAARSERGDA